jgi:hypothetical protein
MTASFLGSARYNCGGSLIASQGKLFSNISLIIFFVYRPFSERDNVTRFFASGFLHESSSPMPLKITLGSFGIVGAWGKLIHEKNLKSKITGHCPFK